MANIEALNELIRVVRDTPDSDFDMGRWECGTVGCALGRAAMDGWFNHRGLFFDKSGSSPIGHIPTFEGKRGVYAGVKVFEISEIESNELFNPCVYWFDKWMSYGKFIGREVVIARIQHLIDHYTLQRDAHVRTYRAAQTVAKIIEQAAVPVRETVEA